MKTFRPLAEKKRHTHANAEWSFWGAIQKIVSMFMLTVWRDEELFESRSQAQSNELANTHAQ